MDALWFLICALSLPTIAPAKEVPWSIKKLDKAPLLFEEDGPVIFYQDEWTVITRITMTNFSDAINSAETCHQDLQKFCNLMGKHTGIDVAIQSNCNATCRESRRLLASIRHQGNSIAQSFWRNRRPREINSNHNRAIKWAFGVMDNEDAKRIYGQLELLNNTTYESISMAQTQVTLLKASYRSLADPVLRLQNDMNDVKKELNNQTKYLATTMKQTQTDLYWLKYEAVMQSLANRILTTMASIGYYVNEEATLMNCLYQNQLPPTLLSNDVLNDLYHNISGIVLLHPDFKDFYNLHMLTTLDVTVIDKTIVIRLKIPLPGVAEYTLNRIYKIPNRAADGRTYVIDIAQEYIVESETRHMLMSRDQLNNCLDARTGADRELRVCRVRGTWLTAQSSNCIVKLMQHMNVSLASCRYLATERPLELLLPMHQLNTWLFSFIEPTAFYMLCDKRPSVITLNGTGTISFKRACVLSNEEIELPYYSSSGTKVDQHRQYRLSSYDDNFLAQSRLPVINVSEYHAKRMVVTDHEYLREILSGRLDDINDLMGKLNRSHALLESQSNLMNSRNWNEVEIGLSFSSILTICLLIGSIAGAAIWYFRGKRGQMEIIPNSTGIGANSLLQPVPVQNLVAHNEMGPSIVMQDLLEPIYTSPQAGSSSRIVGRVR